MDKRLKVDKTATSCYLKATKESTEGYRKRLQNLLNEIGLTEILHAKFVVFSRTIDLQKCRFSNCGERLKKMK